MSTQLLFYENVKPISKQEHGDLCVEAGPKRFEFSRSVNSVPLMAIEMPHAAREYTIVFAGEADSTVPVVLLGIEGDRNLYVAEDGSWRGRYVPAFVRRYPFVFATSDEGQRFTLCIDEGWGGCNREGRGEALFDGDGERTKHLQQVLDFLQDYQRQFQMTQAFCQRLRELELLEPMRAQFKLGDQERSLSGFSAIKREKLKALPAERLDEMMKNDMLELCYIHLQSLNNFHLLASDAASVDGAAG